MALALAATSALPVDAPVDPDAQATVTDFLDFTEHLPSDAVRSLTLIRKQDGAYLSRVDTIHRLLTIYGQAKSTPRELDNLRSQVSAELAYALQSREAAAAEAERMHNELERHHIRLSSVATKLRALPKPPSRDPTPVPQPPLALATRTRPPRQSQGLSSPPPRITLRLDNALHAADSRKRASASQQSRHRVRTVTPGEVLAPPNQDSALYTDSETETPPQSPAIEASEPLESSPARKRVPKSPKIKVPKPPKQPKLKREHTTPRPPRPPRPPGMGTNVHSAVAGISTSNALSLLTPPPSDAKPGSVHAPWLRLTEWEMAKLRKRMKKNAIWTPSETMIRRELSEAGRGPENYRKTKAKADEAGEEFVDCDNIATTAPGKPLVPGEISADSLGLGEKLSNKGMKLNEAKKLKRQLMAQEQAANEAAEAAEAVRSGITPASTSNAAVVRGQPLKPREDNSASVVPSTTKETSREKKQKASGELGQKRKRDTSIGVDNQPSLLPIPEATATDAKTSPKKRKLAPAPISSTPSTNPNLISSTTTTTVPLAAPASTIKKATSPNPPPSRSNAAPVVPAVESISPPTNRKQPTAASSRARRASVTGKSIAIAAPTIPEPTGPQTRQQTTTSSSRPTSRRASVVPPSTPTLRDAPRRKSATPAPSSTAAATAAASTNMTHTTHTTAASRRSKRPAPGPVTNSQEGGGPAVSVGKRQNAPRKKGKRALETAAAAAANVGREEAARQHQQQQQQEEEAGGEDIDPDEPRYCLCGDVSFGVMICCENEACEKEWFHLECVGLQEPPGRRVKWYCPECDPKVGKK